MAFTDIGDSAPWRATFARSEPWDILPAFATIEGFDLKMIFPDLLHIWNLGVARDLLGTALKVVLQEQFLFTGPNINSRLQEATESLRAYARRNKYGLKMKRFTKKKLTWQSKKFPELRASGSDSHVVGVWLEEVLSPHSNRYTDICSMLWCSNRLARLLYDADRFLNDNELATVKTLGRMFCQIYLNNAVAAVTSNSFMYRVRPKFHMYLHVCESMHGRLNASFYSTWMDEDCLKKSVAR